MACFHPLRAWQLADRSVVFTDRRGDVVRELKLPCGQCVGCRLARSRQWATRVMHEAQFHEHSCFVTLTYDDDHLPDDLSLNYRDFQLFMKRLRKKFGAVRFFMCGEYGDELGRPHFHAILFGVRFPDLLPIGRDLFTSKILASLWPSGLHSVGSVTFQSAAYVARYCVGKVTGRAAFDHYGIVDLDTGEIRERVPEFARMSLKPGIGARWFEKFKSDVFPHDFVVVNGHECKPPRYYWNKLIKLDNSMAAEVEYTRFHKAARLAAHETPERLAVREKVTNARLNQLKRSL